MRHRLSLARVSKRGRTQLYDCFIHNSLLLVEIKDDLLSLNLKYFEILFRSGLLYNAVSSLIVVDLMF